MKNALRTLGSVACLVVILATDPHSHWQGAHDAAVLAFGLMAGLVIWAACDLWASS